MARLTTQQRLELELGLRRDVDGDASPPDVSPPPSVLTPMNGNPGMTSHVGAKKAAPPPTAPKPASRSPAVSPGVSPGQFRKADVGIQGYRPVTFNPANASSSPSTSYATPFPSATLSSSSSSSLAASAVNSSLDADLPLPPPPADLMAPSSSSSSAADVTSGFNDFPPPPNSDELFPPPPPPIVADHSSIPNPVVNPSFAANKNYSNNNNAAGANVANNNNVLHPTHNNNNNNNNPMKSAGYPNSKHRQFQPPTFHGKLQDKEEKSIPLASILTKSLRQNDPSSPTGNLSPDNRPKSPTNHQLSPALRPKSPNNNQSLPTNNQFPPTNNQFPPSNRPKSPTNHPLSPANIQRAGANQQIKLTPASPTAPTTATTMAKQENHSGAPFSKPFNINANGGAPEIVQGDNSFPYKSSNSVNNNAYNNNNNSRSSPSFNASRPSQSNHSTNEYSPSPVASDKQRRNPSTSGDALTPKRNSSEMSASNPASASGQLPTSASGQNPVMRSVKPPISPASSQRSSGSNPSDFTHEAEVDKLTDQLLKGLRATKDPNFYGMCAKCGGEVLGEATGCQAMDNIFHVKCFTCSVCSSQLKGKPFYAMEGKPFCEDCYLNTLEKCSVCSKPITDRILRATGKPYHPACFICVVCGKSLDGIPFTVDATNQIHCIEDFHNKFAPKCHVCGLGIVPEPGETETVRIVALDRSFHVHCYKCEDCGLLLGQVNGEQRPNYPLDGHILCQQCNANRIRQLTSPPVTDL